jgi:hypothetical protein
VKSELLDQLIELAERQARLVLLELKLPKLMPAWVLMDKSRKPEIVATPWNDELEKQLYADILRTLMRQKNVIAYSFVSEAWTRSLEPGEWDKDSNRPLDGLTAGQHPARQEAVIAYAGSRDLSRWKQWRIVREATTERIVDLQEQTLPECEVESWISDLLKEK